MPVDSRYIEACALDFANVPKIDRRYTASVHLEHKADERFWDAVLQANHRGQYNYIYESRAEKDGNPTSGVDQCLRYKPYLSKTFFVCIDSDLRYLQQETGIDAEHYIFQTYTYSWENHYCLAEQIQQRLTELSPEVAAKFDFTDFLHQLSVKAYEPLLYLLEALAQKLVNSKIAGAFNDCVPSQCPADVLDNNGAQLISQIQANLLQFMRNPAFAQIDIAAAKEKYKQLGLTKTNAYLHLRGKNIFGILAHIGNIICRSYRINFKTQVLLPSLQLSGYWEIEKITNDIELILNTHFSS